MSEQQPNEQTAASLTGKAALVKKLAEVMAKIKHVAKRGRNEFHNYDYATEADIADAVREGLSEAGIMIIPNVTHHEWREVTVKSGKQAVALLTVEYTITDGSSEIVFKMVGEGQDSGDKCTYKAITGATKYALLKLFLIPTGDDPERDHDDKSDPRKAKKEPAKAGPESPQSTDPLTKDDRSIIAGAAKASGFKGWSDLKPFLQSVGGVDNLNAFPHSKVGALVDAIVASKTNGQGVM